MLALLQSAYREHQSTETATLRVTSDVFNATDAGQVTVVALLDLSAAFDTVDHDILLRRLNIYAVLAVQCYARSRHFKSLISLAANFHRLHLCVAFHKEVPFPVQFYSLSIPLTSFVLLSHLVFRCIAMLMIYSYIYINGQMRLMLF